MTKEIYLVRTGDYNRGGDQKLTDMGREQAARARDALLERNLKERSVLMTSFATGAVQTAEIIDEALNVQVIFSSLLEIGGLNPMRIPDFDSFIETELADNEVTLGDQGLVVVTHGPLIAVLKGLTIQESHRGVEQGAVWQYEPGLRQHLI